MVFSSRKRYHGEMELLIISWILILHDSFVDIKIIEEIVIYL